MLTTTKVVSAFPPGTTSLPCVQPKGAAMKPTRALHELGQSLWLDNVTRELLNSGTLQRYIDELLGDGAHVEPHDFRSCDQEQHDL